MQFFLSALVHKDQCDTLFRLLWQISKWLDLVNGLSCVTQTVSRFKRY
jgi:hypothetical protein